MNNSLPIFYSKSNLTTRFADYSNVYLLPIVCAFGIFTSFLSILVSSTRSQSYARLNKRDAQLLNKTFDYILLNSIIDFLFLLIESFLFIIRCGTLCPHGFSYAAKFYEVYFYLYFAYSLVMAQVFLNIHVAIDMLKMLNAHVTSNHRRLFIYGVAFLSLSFSMIFNLPGFLISKEILPFGIYMPNPNSTNFYILYVSKIRTGFETELFQDILIAFLIIKNPVMYVSLVVLNILVCIKYRKYIKSKRNLITPVNCSKINFI